MTTADGRADPDMAASPPAVRPPRRRNWLGRLIVLAAAFAAGLFTMGYALTHWDVAARYLRAAPAPVAVRSAPPRVVAAAAPPPILVAPSAAALDGVDRRVDELETRLSGIDAQARAAAGNASRAEGLLIAFAARRAIDRGAPLGYLEPLLKARFGAGQPQAVATVITASRQPATLDDLRAGLAGLGPQLVANDPDIGWWQAVRREWGQLIVIRRATTPSIAPDDRLARAKAAVEGGHVDRALAEVARLPGNAVAGPWIAAARRYAATRNALDLLETAALTVPIEPPPAPRAVAQEPGGPTASVNTGSGRDVRRGSVAS